MKFKDYSFRDYLYRPILIFPKSEMENFKKMIKRGKEEKIFDENIYFHENGNSILAYGYIDHSAGSSFKLLSFCEYSEDDIKLFDLPDSFMMIYRNETFSGDSFIFPPDDLDLKPYSKMIEMANEGYYYSEDVENLRKLEKIDKFRHVDYPDDIVVFLVKEKDEIESDDIFGKYDIELVWVRTEKIISDNIIQGTLLNSPYNDYGIDFDSLVDVHIGNDVCYIDTNLSLDIGNYFKLAFKQIEDFKTEGNYNDAFCHYNELKNMMDLINDKKIFIDCVFNQSFILLQTGQFDYALEIIGEADLSYINNLNFHLFSLKGQILIQKDESLKEALELYKKVAKYCKNNGKTVNFIDALTNQAIVYKKLGCFDEALEIYETIEDIYQNTNDIKDETYLNILRNKSIFFEEFGKYNEDMETVKKMENLAVRLNNENFLDECRHRYKVIFNHLNHNNLIEFFESSKKLHYKNDDIENQLRNDFKKAFVLFTKNDLHESILANRKLVILSRKSNNDLFLAYSLAFEYFLFKYISDDFLDSKKESYKISKKHDFKDILVFLDNID
jgi:tetratricopeptide (TPR) repeat protein